ncbi:MAG TPA: prepilin-type N-terminal cleavage/methylation domain-containing protein [Planctomycetota bacterium]|nr:prepilin-type N-terminal cleavage/methylation domain-containing protein [Planctomycetota bacterium]
MQQAVRLNARPGLTLIEVMIFFAILSIAMLGALSIYSRHVMGGRMTEQRRIAMIAAEEKLDELRSAIYKAVQSGATDPLGYVYSHTSPADNQFYGPLPANNALSRPCCFNVAGLTPVPGISVGTVTIINDETPDEAQFGLAYNGSFAPPLFGVDINGNRRYTDASSLSPFPMDINNNGTTTDNVVVDRFSLLPVVITIQWTGPYGRERIDVFSVLTADKQ